MTYGILFTQRLFSIRMDKRATTLKQKREVIIGIYRLWKQYPTLTFIEFIEVLIGTHSYDRVN